MIDRSNPAQAEREAQRVQVNREELAERIARYVPEDGVIQPLAGLYLARRSAPLAPVPGVMRPSFCVIAQGSKEISLGDHDYRYDPFHYLLTTVELPRLPRYWKLPESGPTSACSWNSLLLWLAR